MTLAIVGVGRHLIVRLATNCRFHSPSTHSKREVARCELYQSGARYLPEGVRFDDLEAFKVQNTCRDVRRLYCVERLNPQAGAGGQSAWRERQRTTKTGSSRRSACRAVI